MDATCVQTTIHHPSDSGLLVDSVRTLSRFMRQAKPYIEGEIKQVKLMCRSRLRSARRVAQLLHRLLRRNEEEKLGQQTERYHRLITTTEHMLRQAEQFKYALAMRTQKTNQEKVQRLLAHVEQVVPLIGQVIAQSRTRMRAGRKVTSQEKVLSLHELHTRSIPRYKGGDFCGV